MAILKDTTINGTLTLTGNGYITLPKKSVSWLQGFQQSPIKVADATDNSGYHPWIIQKNTSASKMFTMGIYQNYFVIAGSTTSRTTNGYDYGWFFNVSNGELKLNNNYLYLHSNNYNNYAPSKTGTGASGTWGINISGNAASLSSTLAISKGGTGATSYTANRLIYYNGSRLVSSNAYISSQEVGIDVSNTSTIRFYTKNNNNNADLRVSTNAGVYHTNASGSSTAKWLIYINTSGTVTANTSDRRKKKYIEDTTEYETTSILKNIKIRNFVYKEDIGHNSLEQNGIFAQDLREAMKANNISNRPWLQWEYNDNDRDNVYYDINAPEKDDMTYSVSYNHMVPALIKGWQMQNKEIEELEKKLAILRIKKINGLSS